MRAQRVWSSKQLLWGVLAGITVLASMAWAKSPPRKAEAEVRGPAEVCTRVAGHGKAMVTELAKGENAYLARLELAPGAKVPEHRDATEEYIHVLSGTGRIWIDDREHPVGPGTTVFMPAGAKVRFENGPASMSAIQVFAGPGPAKKYESWPACK